MFHSNPLHDWVSGVQLNLLHWEASCYWSSRRIQLLIYHCCIYVSGPDIDFTSDSRLRDSTILVGDIPPQRERNPTLSGSEIGIVLYLMVPNLESNKSSSAAVMNPHQLNKLDIQSKISASI